MNIKKTIITLIVLALAWFLLSHMMNNIDTAPETVDTYEQQETVETNITNNTEGDAETQETPDDVVAELEATIAEEESLDSELDDLESLGF